VTPAAPVQASEIAEALLEVARKLAIASQAVPAPPLVVPPVPPVELELVLDVPVVPPVPAVAELAEPAAAPAFPVDVPRGT
jgi:hypothetical protein